MREDNLVDYNPGEQLRLILEQLVPHNTNEQRSFIARLDRLSRSEGELSRTFYNAAIDYLLRRLVRTAQYFDRLIIRNSLPDMYLRSKLREFVSEELDILDQAQERIVTLLIECVRVSKKETTQRRKDRIKREALRHGEPRCYLCGRMVSDTSNLPDSATVDHIWPRRLGGSSDDFNLAIACRRCNETKDESLRAEDFHYEKMSIEVGPDDGDSFSTSFGYDFRVAVSLRYNSRCYQCNRPVRHRGEARYARLSSYDAWHFLNVAVFCSEHAPE